MWPPGVSVWGEDGGVGWWRGCVGGGWGAEGKTATDSSMCLSLCLSPWWHTRMPMRRVSTVQVRHDQPGRTPHGALLTFSQARALLVEGETGAIERGGPQSERMKRPPKNSLSHHPPLPSAQTTAVHEPCYWRSLGVEVKGGRQGKETRRRKNKVYDFKKQQSFTLLYFINHHNHQ